MCRMRIPGLPFTWHVDGGHLNIVELLVQKGADLNVQDHNSRTPLHLACSGGHLNIVELLVQKGADLNVQDSYSRTPLHLACSGGHLNIVELLVQKGADLNVQDKDSRTPLHFLRGQTCQKISPFFHRWLLIITPHPRQCTRRGRPRYCRARHHESQTN
jgi:ankyrin repeat protein